jgi:hypothetical protein
MTFTGNEGAIITLAEGAEMTANYRATINVGDTIGHAVGKNLVNAILNQTGCMGMRIYYAINEKDEKQIVLVGVDENGDDLAQGIIVDRVPNCPPVCGKLNPLNSDI